MAYEKLSAYAAKALGQILPLDADTCAEIVSYTLTLPDHEIESHLLDLLGHSDDSYELISSVIRLKREEDDALKSATVLKSPTPNPKEPLPPKGLKESKQAWNATTAPKPKQTKTRLLGNRTSATISELADLKPSTKISSNQAKKVKKKNLDSLKDIEAALNDLEVENAQENLNLEALLTVRRTCNCMATKHPLFEVAPNCLNCGKIICSKEGLQPCSYCGKELLSEREKLEIISILRSERDQLETKVPNLKAKSGDKAPPKKIKYAMTAGGNLWKEQDAALKKLEEELKRNRQAREEEEGKLKEIQEQAEELERYERQKDVNPDLLKAQERLDTLLHFQETGAERSKVIDNASDFEMPGVSSGSIWLSPVERALQLKKQQKQLRKIEEHEKSRTGRSKVVVEMVIKDGKVKMVEKLVISHDEPQPEDKDIEELLQVIHQDKLAQEIEMSKRTWDYEKEQDKWERPVYTPSESAAVRKADVSVSVPSKSRVQFGYDNDDELVAAMPS